MCVGGEDWRGETWCRKAICVYRRGGLEGRDLKQEGYLCV